MRVNILSWCCSCSALILFALGGSESDGATLFEEKFEDANFKARGWYDNTSQVVSSVEHLPGSLRSIEFHWKVGGRTPDSGLGMRRKFAATDALYAGYWVKYSTNYTGSNKPYHPHEFNMVTTKDGDYVGPAFTHLTGYIEQNEGRPVLAIQDGSNIDQNRIGTDLRGVTENRAVAGCNGNNPDGYASVDCYVSGTVHVNGKVWKAAQVYFQDAPGRYYKSDWHHVEAWFQMNSISNGVGQADGQLRYWYDGELLIERTNVMMRTGANADMKWNQFLIAPYIGDGSPVDQSFWVDNLLLATTRPVSDYDRDGLPDDFELANGLNRFDPLDAGGDADQDGFSNFAEYLAGTNPADPKSRLQFGPVQLQRDGIHLSFETVAGKIYAVERATDLARADWREIGANLQGTGGSLEVLDGDLPAQSGAFYRIRLAAPAGP